jgi:hypothetical protein
MPRRLCNHANSKASCGAHRGIETIAMSPIQSSVSDGGESKSDRANDTVPGRSHGVDDAGAGCSELRVAGKSQA